MTNADVETQPDLDALSPPQSTLSGPTTRILVIDDDPVVRELIVKSLKQCDYSVIDAPNGNSGLKLIKQIKPHLVLCDIHMWDMSGLDVLRQITEDGLGSSMPFIFLTAIDDPDMQQQAMILGADDYLIKPFYPHELLARVQSRLEKYKNIEETHTQTMTALKHSISYALPHELRTPLASILGYASVLQADAKTVTTEEVEEWSTRILASTNRLQHVVENYLIYLQLETMGDEQQKGLRRNIVRDAKPIIEYAARTTAEKYDRVNDLKLDIASVALGISEQDLRKIVNELVDNAFKFSKKGTPVILNANRAHNRYHINIIDRGRGMTAEQIANIGEFMQFNRKQHEQQGLGLGLVLSRRLVAAYGGKMTIKSEAQTGTFIKLLFAC